MTYISLPQFQNYEKTFLIIKLSNQYNINDELVTIITFISY